MRASIVRALSRSLWCALFLPVLAASVHAPGADASRATGRIEGTVRDQAGAPIANAQVFIVGTAFNALTDARGNYLIAKVPAGTVSLRAAFVGYKPTQVEGLRVIAGRTVRQDVVLEATAVEINEITVVTADQSLVPREEAATKQRLSGRANALEEASVTTDRAAAQFGNAPAALPEPGMPRPDWNTEEYGRIYDNRFLAARTNPLSTFSIDVDRASYSNVRRFLTGGQLPPADAVRIEELINYFSYTDQPVRGEHPFSVVTELGDAPWHAGHKLVRIRLQGRRIATEKLPPSNLVFLIDVSGSMQSANKLPLVKQAFRLLVNELRPQDRVAIVVYAGAAGLVLPSTPGTDKARILEAIDRLEAGGSTAGGEGIRLAYDVVKRYHVAGGNNRVILASDGDFNIGVSSTSELVRLVEEKREAGAFLTVLGFGMGNYKDGRMEQLADKGNGNYAYIDNLLEARKVFVTELGGTLFTIAKDVKLQLEFNPQRVRAYRLIGYENRMLAKEDFADDTKDAGELGAGHTVTALYEVVPVGVETDVAVSEDDGLKYQEVALTPASAKSGEWLTVKLRYKAPEGKTSRLLVHALEASGRTADSSEDFRFATAVAAFGMALRKSEFRGTATLGTALELARGAKGEDRDGLRAEFIRLIETAQTLQVAMAGESPNRGE